MDSELVVLASSAATTVVGLLATDAWEQTKVAVTALWQRARPEQAEAIEGELLATRTELLAAREAGDGGAEEELTVEWRTRLRRLLAADPALERELRGLLAELPPVAPSTDRGNRVEMQGRASEHARIYMSGGDMHITGP
ncbi:hypothetical protein ACFWBH_01700 [Streptomyces sp. NPDC059999]|uniref:hypothetical protein n=1 Tax=Streptomyces sp. NPDC059999 TaxID=3347030 RepID=UPI0036A52397